MTIERLRKWANNYYSPTNDRERGYEAARSDVQDMLDAVSPVVQVAAYSVEEAVPEGWVLYKVEATMRAAYGESQPVQVMLVRSREQKDKWFELTEEQKEEIALYVSGSGSTVAAAVANAALSASEWTIL